MIDRPFVDCRENFFVAQYWFSAHSVAGNGIRVYLYCTPHTRVVKPTHGRIRKGNQKSDLRKNRFGILLIFLEGGDRYKIDYSAVAAKSRCVPEMVNIACIINKLCWSGRRDSNPRPSAPKADALPGCATPRLTFSIVSRMVFPLSSAAACDRRSVAGRKVDWSTMHPSPPTALQRPEFASMLQSIGYTAAIVQRQNA